MMISFNDIPLPVSFNPLKHHRNFIKEFIEHISEDDIISYAELMCHNYTDVYTGEVEPVTICNEIIARLILNNVNSRNDFIIRLRNSGNYIRLKLNDESEWILRLGNQHDRYVHIHPSRFGLHTKRFRGSSLKTAYLLRTNILNEKLTVTLDNINALRQKLDLSPVKQLKADSGILICYSYLFEDN